MKSLKNQQSVDGNWFSSWTYIVILSPREYWYCKMIAKNVTENLLGLTTNPHFNLKIYPKLYTKGNQMKWLLLGVYMCESISQ